MQKYLDLVAHTLNHGTERADRTGVGTIATFGNQVTFDLREGFPATTVKRLAFAQVVGELITFIRGEHMLEDFHKRGVRIWDANAKAAYWSPEVPGDTGRIYGVNWRDWQSVTTTGHFKSSDQLKELVKNLKTNPFSRRHLVITYNPGELDQVCLPPCHYAFQCYVENGHLDLIFIMRSLDLFLGAPFDIASYAILQTLLAREAGLKPRYLTMQTGDTHIYLNHIPQVMEMLSRAPRALPTLVIKSDKDIFTIEHTDFELANYTPHDAIKAEMAV